MKLTIIRTLGTDTETLGELHIDGTFFCYTLEDAVRDRKIKAETCIPYGQYKMRVTQSSRFKRLLPLVYNNPKTLEVVASNGDVWAGIRLHGGNTHLDTEGCPLVAYNKYENKPTTFVKNGKSYTINNWIQGSAEKDLVAKLSTSAVYDFEIIHKDSLQKQTLYRLRNPMMKDDNIKVIQQALFSKGYQKGKLTVDGWFGPTTEQAVKDFQADKNLTEDGIVGKETLKRLIGKETF